MKVFYRPQMVGNVRTYSPSPGKPSKVLEDWKRSRLAIEVCDTFRPMPVTKLYAVHSRAYVEGILTGSIRNGFGTYDGELAKTFLYTCGAMAAAAVEAMRTGGAACAPVSGFHHAHTDRAAGFCTFNGLAATAVMMRNVFKVNRVGILDLDYHYGDGTDDIIKRRGIDWISHVSPGCVQQGQAEGFLRALPALMQHKFKGCAVLLYQAGADAHINDPLGGWMTTEQLALRDEIVFKTANKIGLPVAWNLAGGYQQTKSGAIPVVLQIHRNTMQKCIEVYG